MGSSEIEIISDSSSKQAPPEPVITDVFGACAYGDLAKLRSFVEKEGGSSLLTQQDGNGFYPLQWAALNNFPDAVHYVLQNGARVDAVDAVHVAAQYGQTSFLNFIVSKYHADFDVPDNDGRTPLHWAAYKGFADTIRLLLFWDANQGKQDKEGCTPLHWAALRGHVEPCVVLLHAGTKEELMVKDTAGFTPAQIAADRGHRHISLILSNALRAHNSCWKEKGWMKKVGDIGYAPILFCIVFVSTIIFINSVLFASNLLKVTAVVGLWGWTAVSFSVASLMMFVRCSSKDPGYVMSKGIGNNAEVEGPLLTIDLTNTPYWTGNWSQLCPTCKIIRPIRSKHCPSCKRCVEQFDHHCPWISNCVGKKNKWDFFVFLFLGTLTSLISGVVAVHRTWTSIPSLQSEELWIMHVIFHNTGAAVFLFIDFFILLACGTLMTVQAYQIGRNITTNESVNASRYGYLQGADGRFSNPYNHGAVKNCSDFLIRGYTDDGETAWPPLQQEQIDVTDIHTIKPTEVTSNSSIPTGDDTVMHTKKPTEVTSNSSIATESTTVGLFVDTESTTATKPCTCDAVPSSPIKSGSEKVGDEHVMNENPSSYASILSPTSLSKKNLWKLEANVPKDADYDVWLPLASVHEVNDRLKNSLYGWIKLDVYENCTPMMLDSFTNSMCLESWGRSNYAIILIEINACNDFSDQLVVVVPNLKRNGYTKETISTPKRAVNQNDKGKGQTSRAADENFIEVKKKKLGCNSFETLNDGNHIIEEVAKGSKATTSSTQEEEQSSTL
ncbi:probable protein S-acyltransferase 23 [Tanacetum coccineum]